MGQRRRGTIPIHLGLNKSIEDAFLTGGGDAPEIFNGIVEITGDQVVVTTRPGLIEFSDLSTANSIDGITWSSGLSRVIAVSNTESHKIDSSGTPTQLTGDYFTAGNRVVFAEDFATFIYAADQGKINILSTSAVTEMGDVDAPTTVGFIAFHDRYLLAQEIGTIKCHFSDVGEFTTWSSNWFSAEAKEDKLQAMAVENLEILLLCNNSGEIWYDTGASDPFARYDGGYIPTGIIAPYTLKWCGSPINSWVWIDSNRNLVRMSGRTPISISDSLNKYLQQDHTFTITDAAADFFVAAGHPMYIIHLPTENKTLCYDFQSSLWSRWSHWQMSMHDRWAGNCAVLATDWERILVGDNANGKIYSLDEDVCTDDGDNIKMEIRTEHIDHGDADATKICNYVEFRFKKAAYQIGTTTITIVVKYRDQGSISWSSAHNLAISIENTGSAFYTGRLRRLGRYKTRQWSFSVLTPIKISMFPPIEDFEVVYP